MKAFDSDISAELALENFQPFWLLYIATTTAIRFTDLDIPIYHESNLYSPRGLKIGDIASSSDITAETVKVELDDADQVLSAILLNEDARNKDASLYFGVIAREDISGETQTSRHIQEIWRGFLGGWELSGDSSCSLTLQHEFALWNKQPLRTQSATCAWPFKGTECQYAGEAGWCDQTYTRCKKLLNSDNFGGFRFLPSVMEQEIWWGRARKSSKK